MRAIATTYKNNPELTRVTTIKIMARRNAMTRLKYLVQSSDWDEKILACEKWLNKICLAFIGFSAVYFISGLILR